MEPGKKGMRVRVREANPFDDYSIGDELVVEVVDPSDGTFRGRNPGTGRVGGWLNWSQVEQICGGVGWDFLKGVLTPETVQLLSAFDGLEGLRLRAEVGDAILLEVPDLEDRIREISQAQKPGRARLKRGRRPTTRGGQGPTAASHPRPSPEDDPDPDSESDPDPEEGGEGPWLEEAHPDLESLSHLEDLSDVMNTRTPRTPKEA